MKILTLKQCKLQLTFNFNQHFIKICMDQADLKNKLKPKTEHD